MPTEDSRVALSRFPVRWRWITAVGIALVVLIALVLASSARPGENPPTAGSSVSPTPSGSSPPTPVAGASPTPSASPAPAAEGAPGTPPPDSPSPPDSPVSPEPPRLRPSPSAAPLGSTPEVVPGVEVTIDGLESVEGVATRPGDVAGPAIRFTVTVANGTDAMVSLNTAVVTVDYGSAETPASELSRPGGSSFPPTVAPGATAVGKFVFTVPSDERGQIRITVDYSVGAAPVVFEGSAPRT